MRPRIYLLYLRQFSNINETRRFNGTMAQNGVGKFSHLNDQALEGLKSLGVTHVWLLGVLRQASGTAYPQLGLPADDPDLLKGLAGSPYAVRDCFDVCPDYADAPSHRLDEFKALLGRMHQHGLKVLIDLVPNHVARSHRSVVRPDLDFGLHEDRTQFYAPGNNFYHLPGSGPLELPTLKDGIIVSPTCLVTGGCDGRFDGESDQARVTGNNVTSPRPSMNDWYETVKLNYGLDFRGGRHGTKAFPTLEHPDQPIPDTWLRMDAVMDHWQAMGVDGFRCDMAHWVPLEFWSWAIRQARQRQPQTLFIAEAYDNDPNKLTDDNVLLGLVRAGFDAVYDHQAYEVLKGTLDGQKWANDLDHVLGAVAPIHHSLRYAENHDEVRTAHPDHWGGPGTQAGLAVSTLLFGIGRGPVMLHGGQEIGEPALEKEGFAGGNGRTSIFDYGSMPELVKWVNGHQYDGGGLSSDHRRLRNAYARLLNVLGHPALAHGDFIPLNLHNVWNPHFGRIPGETASGHWLYAWIRHHRESGTTLLCVVNLHTSATLKDVRVRLPDDVLLLLGLVEGALEIVWADQLAEDSPRSFRTTASRVREGGVELGDLEAGHAFYLALSLPLPQSTQLSPTTRQ